MTRSEEDSIISAVLSGDRNAFEAIVLEYQKPMYNLALKMLGNEQDALDVTQEAFLSAYKNLKKFCGDSSFSTWLYRIATNLCLDSLRSDKRKKNIVSISSMRGEDDEDWELQIPDPGPTPETLLEKKELKRDVSRAMEALPDIYRQTLFLREISGLSYEEIGQTLDLEPGTVKSRIFRARKKLFLALTKKNGNFSESETSNTTKEA